MIPNEWNIFSPVTIFISLSQFLTRLVIRDFQSFIEARRERSRTQRYYRQS